MSRSGFNRKSALATVTMVLAAEAADVDVVWSFRGSIEGLQHHRGITHSFVGVPFIAAGALAFVWLLQRFRRKPLAATYSPPVRWGFLYFCALLAALSHLLLDYTTAYGIRLMEPFNYRWYSWDIVYIVEPLMLLAFIAALAIPGLLGLVSSEVGARSKLPRGRGAAIAALVFVSLLYGYRDYEHRRAVTAMSSFLYHEATPQRVAAYPYMINPFRWHGVVETKNFFETVPVNSSGPDVAFNEGIQYFKPSQSPALEAADNSYFGHVYLDWAAFPYMRVVTNPQDRPGYLVEYQDLRYTYPPTHGLAVARSSQHAPLAGFVLLSPDMHVLAEGMNTSRPPSLEIANDSSSRR
jgi:inner membrane protein